MPLLDPSDDSSDLRIHPHSPDSLLSFSPSTCEAPSRVCTWDSQVEWEEHDIWNSKSGFVACCFFFFFFFNYYFLFLITPMNLSHL